MSVSDATSDQSATSHQHSTTHNMQNHATSGECHSKLISVQQPLAIQPPVEPTSHAKDTGSSHPRLVDQLITTLEQAIQTGYQQQRLIQKQHQLLEQLQQMQHQRSSLWVSSQQQLTSMGLLASSGQRPHQMLSHPMRGWSLNSPAYVNTPLQNSSRARVFEAQPFAASAFLSQPHDNQRHSSPFERWVLRDADSPSSVIKMLQWREIAILHSVCSATQQYISSSERGFSSHDQELRLRSMNESTRKLLSNATWLHKRVQQLKVSFLADRDNILGLSPLSKFRNLRQLHLDAECVMGVNPALLEFVTTLSMLEMLHVVIKGDAMIRIQDRSRRLQGISFAPLRHLSRLASFIFDTFSDFALSKQQMDDLLQCRSLEHLDCGLWTGGHWMYSHADVGVRSQQLLLEETTARLHLLPRLRKLVIRDNHIFEDSWQHLTKCTSLTSLSFVNRFPICLGLDKEWQLLANLSNLTELHLPRTTASSIGLGRRVLPSIHMWPALLQCSNITSLVLGEMQIATNHVAELALSMKRLRYLGLHNMKIESLLPLSEARALEFIDMDQCMSLDDRPIPWLQVLPIMPSIRRCYILERRQQGELGDRRDRSMVIAGLRHLTECLRTNFPNAEVSNIQVRSEYEQQPQIPAFDEDDSDSDSICECGHPRRLCDDFDSEFDEELEDSDESMD